MPISVSGMLTFCMQDDFSKKNCCMLVYAKVNVFKKFFQEYHHSFKQF